MGHRLGRMRLLILLVSSLVASATAELTVIQEDGWRQLLKGEWMVEFAAPWCPACRALQPTWEEFGGWSEDLEVGVGQVHVDCSSHHLSCQGWGFPAVPRCQRQRQLHQLCRREEVAGSGANLGVEESGLGANVTRFLLLQALHGSSQCPHCPH